MGFSPEAEDVEGVVQECDTDLSPDADSKDKETIRLKTKI